MIVLGMVFDIAEDNFKKVLLTRLHQHSPDFLKQQEKQIQDRVTHTLKNPQPIFQNARCRQNRKWHWDPTFILARDAVDMNGQVLVKKGTRYNPLQHRSLSTQWVFIEGEDKEQVVWALSQPQTTIVLVNGAPLTLEERYQVPFYFDQGGHYCRKWGIHSFPARAYQDGDKLGLEEVAVLS